MVNSLMALLNSRQSMRKMCGPQSMPASIHLSQITSLSDRSPRDSGHPELGKKVRFWVLDIFKKKLQC